MKDGRLVMLKYVFLFLFVVIMIGVGIISKER